MEIKTIGVLGAGTMGNGIAQVAAQAGFNVIMRDIEDRFVQGGLKNVDKFLAKSVEKGKMTADQKNAVMGRIKGTTKLEDMKACDFIVEAVLEVMDLKKEVFKALDEMCGPEVILSTNTSSMSITEIATATKRPDKVAGMHFFNPVPLMRLVEVVRGHFTSDATVATCMDLVKKLGKEGVEVKKDVPAFIVNRLMIPHFIEAMVLLEEGVASKEDIDKAAKLGLNYPMGPFELMDLTGLDINLMVNEYLRKELKAETKWQSSHTLKNLVKAGRLGRKTGAGWYEYK
ncbi:MAG TPA: 3-hydroxyacyl-CoA dehydrogenase NAD-binding domain-containing protein [Syntrophorhabdales bacterium]|nr:3-hydroxyacyl-CoA dehydrogenase NAD-binding domain-containing protein [Syntrophorhabdales bacterium]